MKFDDFNLDLTKIIGRNGINPLGDDWDNPDLVGPGGSSNSCGHSVTDLWTLLCN